MQKMRLFGKRLSVFWRLLIANLLPCLCSVAILAMVFIPMMQSAARKNDRAYENTMLYAVSACLDGYELCAQRVQANIEGSEWLHPLYIDHILNGTELSYYMKDTITADLAVLVSQEYALSDIAFQFYGEEDAVYSGSGVYFNLPFFQEIAPEKIQYFFFPLAGDDAGFSTVSFHGSDYLCYRAQLSDVSGGRPKGELNLLFPTARIGAVLNSAGDGDAAAFRLVSADGAVLWEVQTEHDAEETVTISTPLPSGSCEVQIDVPLSVHQRTQDSIRPLIVLAILLDLLLCIVSSVLLSQANYRPFQTIVRKFTGSVSRHDNEFDTLTRVLDRMLLEKSESETSLDRLRPLARQKILGSLLDGSGFFLEPNIDCLRCCDLEFAYPLFSVIAVQIPFSRLDSLPGEPRDRQQVAEVVMEALTEQVQGNLCAYLFYEDLDHYRVLINFDARETLLSYLNVFSDGCTRYLQETGETPLFGVGRPVKSREEIYRAAEQAGIAVNFGALNRTGSVVFYAEIASQVSIDYFFPFSEEMLLSRAVADGNSERAKTILSEIMEKNRQQMSPDSLQYLCSDLYSTVARSAKSLGISPIAPQEGRQRAADISSVSQRIAAMIDDVCAQIASRREAASDSADAKILCYIQENLLNPDLSLVRVAEAFHKSPANISTCFKNQTGMNYSDYVNEKRINRAVELMAREHGDITAVYQAVGYVSLSTFRRNFIKYTKQNPGEFYLQNERLPDLPGAPKQPALQRPEQGETKK